MTWPVSAPENRAAVPADGALQARTGRDGSFSLWSERFQEGFHSGRGALREARETFLAPSQLQRFPAGTRITVLEVCVGTGSNLAMLLEACRQQELQLDWTGLELDPRPLRLALAQPTFRDPWQPQTLQLLEQLVQRSSWHDPGHSRGRLLWGDARRTLRQLHRERPEPLDLIWHDAFSPRRCPELWTVEFLGALTGLLRKEGRWISYCSAAAVREALQRAGLQLAALAPPAGHRMPAWSGGTVASAAPLPGSILWRALSAMEHDHLACSAGEPYHDPGGTSTAGEILNKRQQAQEAALAAGSRSSSGAWRRRWGLGRTAEAR
ncbi:MAG: tRNA (5-methylaminomethyl-2-thiouridine)(34)-methyltransferase MnmD [Cyanobium sp.]